MDVNTVSAKGYSAVTVSPADKEIQFLQKCKMQLQEEIKKINEGKLDPKAKKDRVEALYEQIQDYDTRIRQRQLEKIKPDSEKETKNQDENRVSAVEKEQRAASKDSQFMLSASAGYSDLKVMERTRTDLKNKLKAAQGEHSDKGAQDISKRLEDLEEKMAKKAGKIHRELEKSSKAGEQDADSRTEGSGEEEGTDPAAAQDESMQKTDPAVGSVVDVQI